MTYDPETKNKIEAARAALDSLGGGTRGKKSIEEALLSANRQRIFDLLDQGVLKKEIYEALTQSSGVQISSEMFENFLKKYDTKNMNLTGAAEALKEFSANKEMVSNGEKSSVVSFLRDNQSEIKGMLKRGIPMRRIMEILKEHGVICSPDMVKRHIGYVPKKRNKKEQIIVENKTEESENKVHGNRLNDAGSKSVINPAFRNNEGAGKYFKK